MLFKVELEVRVRGSRSNRTLRFCRKLESGGPTAALYLFKVLLKREGMLQESQEVVSFLVDPESGPLVDADVRLFEFSPETGAYVEEKSIVANQQ